jgi:murein L,D-transpeptidase YafK
MLTLLLPLSITAKTCDSDNELVVDGKKKVLHLCEGGKSIKQYHVALGRHGLGKQQTGDGKTPIGEYTIGMPRPSKTFGTFIPINYPTLEQQAKGYTGSAIGIHSPHRYFKWLGPVTTWINWTQGCVAVSSDAQIKQIADWISNQTKPVKVTICE